MFWQWVKKFMPRGIYGRGALILIVPILSILLIVSAVIIQRHFNEVTRQMVRSVAAELTYVLGQVAEAPDMAAAQAEVAALEAPLGFDLTLPDDSAMQNARLLTDWTSPIVARALREMVPGVMAVDLKSERGAVLIKIATARGPMKVRLARSRLSVSNPHQLLVLMLSSGVVLTLVAFIFLRNQLRPIKRLAAAAEAFGKGRHAPYRPSGATEVRAAGQAFLSMRARIERQIEQRTAMLSGVSHDLRTPLTRMKLELSMMEEGEARDALLRDVADMERLVDAFLDFAREEAQDALPAPADPAAILHRVAEKGARAGTPVDLGEVADLPAINMREHGVERALVNLVNNAARYGSHVRLSLIARPRDLAFVVEDDGPGIAPEDREEALKPFTRLDSARNQNRGSGVGLGLAIASDVARSHGGALNLSQSPGMGGLRVELVLPR